MSPTVRKIVYWLSAALIAIIVVVLFVLLLPAEITVAVVVILAIALIYVVLLIHDVFMSIVDRIWPPPTCILITKTIMPDECQGNCVPGMRCAITASRQYGFIGPLRQASACGCR